MNKTYLLIPLPLDICIVAPPSSYDSVQPSWVKTLLILFLHPSKHNVKDCFSDLTVFTELLHYEPGSVYLLTCC